MIFKLTIYECDPLVEGKYRHLPQFLEALPKSRTYIDTDTAEYREDSVKCWQEAMKECLRHKGIPISHNYPDPSTGRTAPGPNYYISCEVMAAVGVEYSGDIDQFRFATRALMECMEDTYPSIKVTEQG